MEREITHACGHVATHQVYGLSTFDTEREATKLARRKCKACYTEVSAARAEAALAGVADLGLPDLIGSQRQVAWATTIRAEKLALRRTASPDSIERLTMMTDAKWWIDRRGEKPAALAKD